MYKCEGYATAIRFSLPQFSQHSVSLWHIIAVHQKGIVFPASEGQSGLICAVREIQFNVGCVQHASDCALNLRVAGEKQSLQSHNMKLIGCLSAEPSDQRNGTALCCRGWTFGQYNDFRGTWVKKRIYLSLGANMGDRLANLRNAIAGLRELGELVAQSSIYETEPVDVEQAQPWFLNCAVAIDTELSAREVLDKILSMELAMGRVR